MKIPYIQKRFSEKRLATLEMANKIIAEYQAQGFELTLRQLYYQFVARGLIANNDREYENLGTAINDGRLAGIISWDAIVDRTRNLRSNSHWSGPRSIVEACAQQFQIDKWETQPRRLEVWIEKDALVGVIEAPCKRNDIGFFSCRGYVSQSEMHAAALRLKAYEAEDQETFIIHLGDHDPSGIDMSRDIQDRLSLFGAQTIVQRVALNMHQVEKYNPPPNPAKLSDCRAEGYIKKFGKHSWELDALEPRVIDSLVESEIKKHRDDRLWRAALKVESEHKQTLQDAAEEMD